MSHWETGIRFASLFGAVCFVIGLHLMNSPEIGEKLHARSGVARELTASDRTPEQIIEELYLGTLSRFPTARERGVMLRVFAEAGADRRAAAEDVLWALLNSKEFVFNH